MFDDRFAHACRFDKQQITIFIPICDQRPLRQRLSSDLHQFKLIWDREFDFTDGDDACGFIGRR